MFAVGIESPASLQAGRRKTTAMISHYGERELDRRSDDGPLARIQGRL